MLILASASPRRRELLGLITPDFRIIPADADETLTPGIPPAEAVALLAARKAAAVAALHPEDTVIGADTLVACGDEIMGKPADAEDAARMLRRLSGRAHSVLTGVCVICGGEEHAFVEESAVFFRSLDEEEIAAYIATGEPMDKAGAYGIQERGGLFVRRIEGDYFNIVGLPLAGLYQILRKTGAVCVFPEDMAEF